MSGYLKLKRYIVLLYIYIYLNEINQNKVKLLKGGEKYESNLVEHIFTPIPNQQPASCRAQELPHSAHSHAIDFVQVKSQ